MKQLLSRLGSVLRPLGYKPWKASFVKADASFYRLVDIQRGAHGGGYFFINVCVHPMGLPKLQVGKISIQTRPKEYDCILRHRIEDIATGNIFDCFIQRLVSWDDEEAIQAVEKHFPSHVEPWIQHWASFSTILSAETDELYSMLTVAPIVFQKATLMLKCFCCHKLGDLTRARQYLDQYLSAPSGDHKFLEVDQYMWQLVQQESVSPN